MALFSKPTFLRSPDGGYVRPFGMFTRDLYGTDIQVEQIQVIKQDWGIPPFSGDGLQRYLQIVATPTLTNYQGSGWTVGGTGTASPPFGAISGYDAVAPDTTQYWGASTGIGSPWTIDSPTTAHGTGGITATLSAPRDPDFSWVSGVAADQSFAGLTDGQAAVFTLNEATPNAEGPYVAGTFPGGGWDGSAVSSGVGSANPLNAYSGPLLIIGGHDYNGYSGGGGGYSPFDVVYSAESTWFSGWTNNPDTTSPGWNSTWSLWRTRFTATTVPVFYWFAEVSSVAMTCAFRGWGIVNAGEWIEIPQPAGFSGGPSEPVAAWDRAGATVVVVVGQSPGEWAAANPTWTLV